MRADYPVVRFWRLALLLLVLLAVPTAHATFGDHLVLDDPQYGAQWMLENTGQNVWPFPCPSGTACLPTTADADIDWGLVYDAGFTGVGVTVAIGTPAGEPTLWCDDADLAPRVVPGRNFVDGTSEACRATPPVSGSEWHDSIVARLAVGEANNGAFGVGVASGAQLMPIVWSQDGANRVFYEQVLPWLQANGVRVIVIPYGGVPVEIDVGQTLAQACTEVATAGPINRAQILAASNVLVLWGQPVPSVGVPIPDAHYPTCDPSSLGVAHTNQHDVSFATSEAVDIAAPGARPDATSIATSWALGNFTGAAAVVLSEDPSLERPELIARLLDSADDLGTPGPDPSYGAGRINLLQALLLGDPDGDGVPGDGDGSGVAGDSPCVGSPVACDDNCPFEPNPLQQDSGGPAGLLQDGDACQCGDLSGDFQVNAADPLAAGQELAGIASGADLTRCNVTGPAGGGPGTCLIDDVVVLRRAIAGRAPGLEQLCAPALP